MTINWTCRKCNHPLREHTWMGCTHVISIVTMETVGTEIETCSCGQTHWDVAGLILTPEEEDLIIELVSP
jgi:hypothetical protein